MIQNQTDSREPMIEPRNMIRATKEEKIQTRETTSASNVQGLSPASNPTNQETKASKKLEDTTRIIVSNSINKTISLRKFLRHLSRFKITCMSV